MTSDELKITKEKVIFMLVFIALGIIALQIPVNVLAGAKVKFTLFDLFAPISGAFLGTGIGAVAVVAMYVINLAWHGFAGVNQSNPLTLVATLRLLPLIAGVWYFSGKNRYSLLIPALAIISFNLHPQGMKAWYYSLFWLIPFAVWPLRNKYLVARSLGSTFTAHAAGGALWIWAFNLPAPVWISLIPTVILERSIFALGISASYIFMTNVTSFLTSHGVILKGVTYEKYSIK